MRVLIINQYCGFGSTGRIVQDLHDLLIENGDECCIAYGRYSADSSRYNTYKIGGKINNYLHVLETRAFDNHGFSSRLATKKFIQFIDQYKPDVIHIHNLHGYYVNIQMLMEYLKAINVKIIWTFHDCWNFSRHAGYIDYVDNELPTKITSKNELREYPKAYFSPLNNYERKKNLFSGFKDLTIVTPSLWLAEMVNKSFFSSYKIKTIYNGVDLNSFYPDNEIEFIKRYGLENKKIILGVASVWDKRKGLKYFNELNKLIDHDREKIVIIGKVEEKITLDDDILYISQTNNISELRQWYSSAEVFINPTIYDNFPTTNLEALVCGTPVITYDSGGSPESINSKNGRVVNKGDINRVFKEIESIKKISEQEVKRLRIKYDKSNRYKEYLLLLEN